MFSPATAMDVAQLLISFTVIWIGSGVLVRAVDRLSKLLRFSRFTLSLFLLGTATSFPEIAVLTNSYLLQQPEVAMGNLIGGQVFLLFLVIPLLALITRGLRLKIEMQGKLLLLILAVIAAPMMTLIDGRVQLWEGAVTLALYGVFVVTFSREMTMMEKVSRSLQKPKSVNVWSELAKVALSVAVLFAATQLAIRGVTDLSAHLHLHPFLVSMIIMALGTNVPEFSLAVRAALSGKRDIILGDYIGSATINTLLWAVLSITAQGTIVLSSTVVPMIILLALGLLTFWWFCRTQKKMSMREGLILMAFYLGFLAMTAWLIPAR
jgi:cation:H+ antiporter